jgi:hypothetical protein
MIKISTGPLLVFAGITFAAALGGCSPTGGASQFPPGATQQRVVARATVSRTGKIAVGSIFVGYGAGAKSYIEIYANEAGKWANLGTITYGVVTPVSMRFDRYGKLFVANYGANAVSTYVDNKFTGTLSQSLATPYGLAISSTGDVAVLNKTVPGSKGDPRITWYVFGTDKYPCVTTKGLQDPRDAAYDGFDVWVADFGANAVLEYEQCSPRLVRAITDGVDLPVAVTIAHYGGGLWVANSGGNSVSEYNYLGPIKTISTGDLQPSALAAHAEHLYIAAYGGLNGKSKVLDYNIKDDTLTEITDGVNVPRALAWCQPNLCVMNAFSVTIYDSSDKLLYTIKVKQSPLSLTSRF